MTYRSSFRWGTAAKLVTKAIGSDIQMTTWKVPGEAMMSATKRDSTRLSFYFVNEEGVAEMLDLIYNGPKEEDTDGAEDAAE